MKDLYGKDTGKVSKTITAITRRCRVPAERNAGLILRPIVAAALGIVVIDGAQQRAAAAGGSGRQWRADWYRFAYGS